MRPSELKMYYASCRSACVPFNRLDPRYNAKLGNVPLETRARLTLSCSRVTFTLVFLC